jgi:hypothetical protein
MCYPREEIFFWLDVQIKTKKEEFYKPCACDGSTPIQYALNNKIYTVVIYFLYNLNRKRVFSQKDINGRSFIQQVCDSGHRETIERAICCMKDMEEPLPFESVVTEDPEIFQLFLVRQISAIFANKGEHLITSHFLSEAELARLSSYAPTPAQLNAMDN